MGSGRDDFSKNTIRKAAGRVGYRCSYPGCPNATIGSSMESPDKTAVTGVAAHICAAAEGGPRYDKNMTVDERKSIKNCIWLCQTHSKLIDSDVKKYTVETLRQWKADAEATASKALANGDYFAEYYKGHGDNLIVLKQLFDDMIIEGQFDLLQTLLDQYKTTLSDQYEEFVLRYRIIHDVYCNRSKLCGHLDDYCSLVCKNGADALLKLFLSFHLKEELRKIVEFCLSEELKKYVNLAIKDELASLFIVPVGSPKTVEIPTELSTVISKYITNHIVQNKIIGAVDVTGAKYVVFSDEFYYRAVKAAYELSCASIYGKGNFEEIVTDSDFLFIKDNIDKIILLDVSLQEYIWAQFLAFLSEKPEAFEIYYDRCPSSLKCAPPVEKARYICRINCNASSIECNALLDYVSRSGDDAVLCMYLSCIEKNAAIEFLDEHSYLLKKNSIYLKLKLDLQADIQPEEARVFLPKYEEIYKDNFTFHLLLAKFANSAESLTEELEWLKVRWNKMMPHDGIDYIRILRKHQCWTDLVELSQNPLPNEYAFLIAGFLSESKDGNYIKAGRKLYQNLIEIGWTRRGLYFNFGVVHRQLGDFEKAKTSFQKEFDLYSDISALHALIQLRYELNEYETDSYFDQLKGCVDADSQNMVAAIYLKRCNYSDARKFFLRSLLLKDVDNPSINGFCQAVSHLSHEDASAVEANVFCVLKKDGDEHRIAVHETDVMEGIVSPTSFANYSHYSAQDVKVSSLLFATQGDSVVWNQEDYTVTEIMPANDAIKRFFFSTLSEHEGVTTICSSSSEDFIEQISAILKKSTEDLNKRIDEYNQLEIRLPLSIFSSVTGKGMLRTCEFLAFENREKIRNNVSMAQNMNGVSIFVLSYDAIVYLVHLGVESELLDLNLMCSPQVKNQLINDINEELSELTDDSQKGTMFLQDGKLALIERTSNMRRSRYTFLVQLKTFVESLHVASHTPVFSSCNEELKTEIEILFSNKQVYCESTSLAVTKNTANAALVTDDQFLFATANTEGLPTIGLTGLLSKTSLSWERLLSASKRLRNMNYGNYLPIHLYKRIVDQMLDSGSASDAASAKIQTWVLYDADGDTTPYHEDVVIALYREVVEQGLDYLNPDNYLTDIVLGIWEKRNPGFIKKCISDAFKSLLDTNEEHISPDAVLRE